MAMAQDWTSGFSDSIVYVTESGDHGLASIDPEYPVFVLVFCIFKKQQYIDRIAPSVARLKMQLWGHSEVILHEHNLKQPKNEFAILLDESVRQTFVNRLIGLISTASITMIASVIDKKKLMSQSPKPADPYEICLSFGLEGVYGHLASIGQSDKQTPVVVQKRGRKEDEEFELSFKRICDGANSLSRKLPYDLVMIDSKSNSTGLQIADFTAHPIGIKTISPDQANRAYEIILQKFRKSPGGEIAGWGLKVFP